MDLNRGDFCLSSCVLGDLCLSCGTGFVDSLVVGLRLCAYLYLIESSYLVKRLYVSKIFPGHWLSSCIRMTFYQITSVGGGEGNWNEAVYYRQVSSSWYSYRPGESQSLVIPFSVVIWLLWNWIYQVLFTFRLTDSHEIRSLYLFFCLPLQANYTTWPLTGRHLQPGDGIFTQGAPEKQTLHHVCWRGRVGNH